MDLFKVEVLLDGVWITFECNLTSEKADRIVNVLKKGIAKKIQMTEEEILEDQLRAIDFIMNEELGG